MGLYSATQSTCIDWGEVGQAQSEAHQVWDCKLRYIGVSGISAELVTVAHTVPSTVYVIDEGVQTTPQVCHWVMSMLSECWICWFEEE